MSEKPMKRRGLMTWLGGRSLWFWAAAALWTVAIYMIGVGLIARQFQERQKHPSAELALETYAFCAPVRLLKQHGPEPVQHAIEWYLRLWMKSKDF